MSRRPARLPFLLLFVAGLMAVSALPVLLPSGATAATPAGTLGPSGGPVRANAAGSSVDPGSAAAPGPAATISSLLDVPGASTPSAMTYDSHDGFMLLVTPMAASTPAGSVSVGTWSYRAGTWTELSVSPAPSAREYASLTYDAANGAAVLFGGYSPSGAFLSDTWTFSGGAWTNVTASSSQAPAPRADASVAYDAAIGAVVLYGGFGATGPLTTGNLTDTWLYERGNWTSLTAGGSPPVEGAMAYDANLSEVVYYGGVTSLLGIQGCAASTYEFNGTTWKDVSGSVTGGPGALALESMTYDPQIGAVVAYGGVCGVGIAGVSVTLSTSNSMWGLSGGAWTELPARAAPAATYGGNFEFDPGSAAFVLFGGVHPALIGLGTLTRQLSEESYLCANDSWSQIGPDLTSSLALAETGMNVTLNVTNAVTAGPATYRYSGLPSGCGNGSGPSVLCRLSDVGNFTLLVNLSIGLGLPGTTVGTANGSASTALTVVPGMVLAPLTVSLSETEVGVPITFASQVTDGVTVSGFHYAGLPPGCVSMSRLSLQCTPTASGNYSVSFTASDQLGVQRSRSVSVGVAPRLSVQALSLSRSVLDLGMATDVTAVVEGGVGPLGTNYTGLPAACPSANSLSLVCRPSAIGQYEIGVSSQDALGVRAGASSLLTVNAAPSVGAFTLSAASVKVGTNATLSVTLVGGTAPFTIRYSGLPAGCASRNSTELACAPTESGNFTIVVNATDALGVSTVASAHLTVAAAPVGTRPGTPSSGIPPFAEGIASGAIVASVLLSALLVRSRRRGSERRQLAEELERGIPTEGSGLVDERAGPPDLPRGR